MDAAAARGRRTARRAAGIGPAGATTGPHTSGRRRARRDHRGRRAPDHGRSGRPRPGGRRAAGPPGCPPTGPAQPGRTRRGRGELDQGDRSPRCHRAPRPRGRRRPHCAHGSPGRRTTRGGADRRRRPRGRCPRRRHGGEPDRRTRPVCARPQGPGHRPAHRTGPGGREVRPLRLGGRCPRLGRPESVRGGERVPRRLGTPPLPHRPPGAEPGLGCLDGGRHGRRFRHPGRRDQPFGSGRLHPGGRRRPVRAGARHLRRQLAPSPWTGRHWTSTRTPRAPARSWAT